MGVKFNWGRALASGGNSLQNYFANKMDQERQERLLQEQRAYNEGRTRDLWQHQDQMAADRFARTQRAKTLEDPWVQRPTKMAEYLGITPDTSTVPFGPTAGVPLNPGSLMARSSDVADWRKGLPSQSKPEKTGNYRFEVDGAGNSVRLDEWSNGTWLPAANKFATGNRGAGQPAPDPLEIPPTTVEDYMNRLEAGMAWDGKRYKVFFPERFSFSGGKDLLGDDALTWERFEDGKLVNAKPGPIRDQRMDLVEAAKKIKGIIDSSPDKAVTYLKLKNGLKELGLDSKQIQRVLPQISDLGLEPIINMMGGAAQQVQPGIDRVRQDNGYRGDVILSEGVEYRWNDNGEDGPGYY